MAFKFYIDNQLTDQPVNDMDLVTRIVRDQSTKNVLITQDIELIWNNNNGLPSGTISGYAVKYSDVRIYCRSRPNYIARAACAAKA